MAITFVAAGTVGSGIGAVSPGLPSGTAANDIGIMVIETNDQAITVSGWTEAASSPQSDTFDGSRITIFWKRLAGGDATTTSDSGNHQVAQIIGFRGCVTTGTPIEATNGNGTTTNNASTAITIPGITTLTDGAMVISVCGDGNDLTSTAEFSGWTNADLASITECLDNISTIAQGGGYGAAYGIDTIHGSVGNTTATLANSFTQTHWMGALTPAGVAADNVSISQNITVTESVSLVVTPGSLAINVSDSITVSESIQGSSFGRGTTFNNYQFVSSGDGISVTEKIR